MLNKRFEPEYRLAHTETIGENDAHYDLDNYADWLDEKLILINEVIEDENSRVNKIDLIKKIIKGRVKSETK